MARFETMELVTFRVAKYIHAIQRLRFEPSPEECDQRYAEAAASDYLELFLHSRCVLDLMAHQVRATKVPNLPADWDVSPLFCAPGMRISVTYPNLWKGRVRYYTRAEELDVWQGQVPCRTKVEEVDVLAAQVEHTEVASGVDHTVVSTVATAAAAVFHTACCATHVLFHLANGDDLPRLIFLNKAFAASFNK